ncbi:uncharacterized protein LOC124382890 isoform X2 [Silurus meridionalis]|uniref:uncharacterized protein LOC124382890 isoform X2 n=1 Tax=Silurus meridionalis TaxID=175797 RepID=UPI001EEB14CC|nr:uncharacterized protein LOC124382890 isoform X2 [Silurus meridionalis]
MPHEKGSDTGAVTVDPKKALTITPGGKLNTGQIHWTQLAANGASSGSAHHHNWRQADELKNDSQMLDIKRCQVKVILMDVLRTEEGQRYLGSCVSDTNAKVQAPLKEEPMERWRERRSSAQHSAVRRRTSAPHNDQTKISPLKLTNSAYTDSVRAEKNYMHFSKEVRSPVAKRCKRFNNSLKHAEPAASDEEYSTPLKQSDFSPSKESHNLFSEHTQPLDENELCQDEEGDSPRSTSTVHSEESDSEQISDTLSTASYTPSQVKQPSRSSRMEHQGLESKDVPAQLNTSENKVQECAEVTEDREGKTEQEKEKEVEEEKPLHQNGEVLDEAGGARGSVLRLSSG